MKKVTERYPEVLPDLAPRSRGSFGFDADACISCGLCSDACPNGVIKVDYFLGEKNKRQLELYSMNLGYCLFCGLCVEVCPRDAIFFKTDFDLACYRKDDTLFTWRGNGHRPPESRLPGGTVAGVGAPSCERGRRPDTGTPGEGSSIIMLQPFLFYFFASIVVLFALAMILSRNLVHSASFMAAAFLGMALVYLLLRADYSRSFRYWSTSGRSLFSSFSASCSPDANAWRTRTDSMATASLRLRRTVTFRAARAIVIRDFIGCAWHRPRAAERRRGQAPAAASAARSRLSTMLLGEMALPLEAAGLLLLAALIGAIAIGRHRGNPHDRPATITSSRRPPLLHRPGGSGGQAQRHCRPHGRRAHAQRGEPVPRGLRPLRQPPCSPGRHSPCSSSRWRRPRSPWGSRSCSRSTVVAPTPAWTTWTRSKDSRGVAMESQWSVPH